MAHAYTEPSKAELLDSAFKKALQASKDVRRLLRRTPVRERVKKEFREAAKAATFQ